MIWLEKGQFKFSFFSFFYKSVHNAVHKQVYIEMFLMLTDRTDREGSEASRLHGILKGDIDNIELIRISQDISDIDYD